MLKWKGSPGSSATFSTVSVKSGLGVLSAPMSGLPESGQGCAIYALPRRPRGRIVPRAAARWDAVTQVTAPRLRDKLPTDRLRSRMSTFSPGFRAMPIRRAERLLPAVFVIPHGAPEGYECRAPPRARRGAAKFLLRAG